MRIKHSSRDVGKTYKLLQDVAKVLKRDLLAKDRADHLKAGKQVLIWYAKRADPDQDKSFENRIINDLITLGVSEKQLLNLSFYQSDYECPRIPVLTMFYVDNNYEVNNKNES